MSEVSIYVESDDIEVLRRHLNSSLMCIEEELDDIITNHVPDSGDSLDIFDEFTETMYGLLEDREDARRLLTYLPDYEVNE